MALASNTYECVGGPKDGDILSIPPGAWYVDIALMSRGLAGFRCDGEVRPPPIRRARYILRRHPTLGYALMWDGEV